MFGVFHDGKKPKGGQGFTWVGVHAGRRKETGRRGSLGPHPAVQSPQRGGAASTTKQSGPRRLNLSFENIGSGANHALEVYPSFIKLGGCREWEASHSPRVVSLTRPDDLFRYPQCSARRNLGRRGSANPSGMLALAIVELLYVDSVGGASHGV